MHGFPNCSSLALQDVGRRNIFMADEAVDGSPKLVIWDMSSNTMERTFVFPDYVASWEGSFLNDIVLDVTRGYAYMTNTWGEGGIVVYAALRMAPARIHV